MLVARENVDVVVDVALKTAMSYHVFVYPREPHANLGKARHLSFDDTR